MTTATERRPQVDDRLQALMVNTIRTLSIDAVQKANSGHPGAPLGAAPAGYTLFTKVMRYNPRNPDWANRDRFVLSAGHASMLLYSLLYLTGYDLTLDDIKQFRQWESRTPGHPEYRITKGVETSTGPLGQGFTNAVGMAIGEAFLATHFNRPGLEVVDHYTYGICSDGDLQEGVTSEAASLAGHLQLGKLIFLDDEPFTVPQDALDAFRQAVPRGEEAEAAWNEVYARWEKEYPDLAEEWKQAQKWSPVDGWDSDLPSWDPDPSGVATREAGGKAMNAIAAKVPFFMGGDADLAPSTKNNLIGFGDCEPGNYSGRNIHFGVRQNSMGSIVNGIVVHGFLRAFGATFFTFSDYQRPAIRMAAIMDIPTIFLYTHDSVLLGEDGPTHQPIEHLISLRVIPHLVTLRPADANETVEAWRWIMTHWEHPVALVLTRQKVPVLDRSSRQGDLSQGAYVLQDADGGKPDIILIGTGSEVSLCVAAREALKEQGVGARVVSMPS